MRPIVALLAGLATVAGAEPRRFGEAPLPGQDALRAACLASVREGGGSPEACERYAETLRPPATAPVVTTPPRAASPPPAQRPTPRPSRPTSVVVAVRECREHRHGSLDYRECRAREAARLADGCQRWQERAQHPGATGPQQRQAAEQARAWCAASRRYRIVD